MTDVDTTSKVDPFAEMFESLSFEGLDQLYENPDIFMPVGQIVPVIAGQPVDFRSEIEGKFFDYTVLIKRARLTRLTQMVNKRGDGSLYNLISGTLSNVDAQITIHLPDGGGDLSLPEFFLRMTNANQPPDKQLSTERFNKVAKDAGFHWGDGTETLLFQHFGGSERKRQQFFADFIEAGARDVTGNYDKNRLGRIKQILAHEDGLLVERFEIGSQDRSQSRTGQGFLNLLDAGFMNFRRVILGRIEADKLAREFAAIPEDQLSPEDRLAMTKDIANIRRQSSRWVTNLGGAQQRMVPQADGSLVPDDIWDETDVPCGRVTVKKPVYNQVLDPENKLPMLGEDSRPVLVRAKEVMLDGDDNPILGDDNRPIMVPSWKMVEYDFWKAQGDNTDDPVEETKVVDTTAGAAVNTTEGSATEISDEDEF